MRLLRREGVLLVVGVPVSLSVSQLGHQAGRRVADVEGDRLVHRLLNVARRRPVGPVEGVALGGGGQVDGRLGQGQITFGRTDEVESVLCGEGLREGAYPGGREVSPAPALFIGAADAPRPLDDNWKPDGLLAKLDAGADFFQTQYCFDMDVLRAYMARLGDEGITERAFFLIGIGPIASVRSARYMNENLFGVYIPEPLIKRLEGAEDQRAEGRAICAELLQELREIDGVSGAHLMAPRQENSIAQVIEESGVLAER